MMAETAVQNFEESYHLYENVCLYCGIAAIVFLLLSAVLFVTLHIPQVFGELTGRTARRAVQQMTGGNPRNDKAAAGKKVSGLRSYRELDGKNDTPAGRMPPGAAAPAVMQGIPEASINETSTLPLKETGTSAPGQPQENIMQQEPRAERKGGFVVLRSIVEIHTDEVIEE